MAAPRPSPSSARARRRSVRPPVSLTLHVFTRIAAEVGRAEHEDLEALRTGLVPSPCARRNAHDVPLLELDDLVVELHPPVPAHYHEHLLLLLVRVAVREPVVGRDALIAQAGLFELKRLTRDTELQVRRAVEVGPDVRQIGSEVPERERHDRESTVRASCRRAARATTRAPPATTPAGTGAPRPRPGDARARAGRPPPQPLSYVQRRAFRPRGRRP